MHPDGSLQAMFCHCFNRAMMSLLSVNWCFVHTQDDVAFFGTHVSFCKEDMFKAEIVMPQIDW